MPPSAFANNRVQALVMSESIAPIYTGLLLKEESFSYHDRVNEVLSKFK